MCNIIRFQSPGRTPPCITQRVVCVEKPTGKFVTIRPKVPKKDSFVKMRICSLSFLGYYTTKE
jgi:hypothetical protein